jgi:hypothetical protein
MHRYCILAEQYINHKILLNDFYEQVSEEGSLPIAEFLINTIKRCHELINYDGPLPDDITQFYLDSKETMELIDYMIQLMDNSVKKINNLIRETESLNQKLEKEL